MSARERATTALCRLLTTGDEADRCQALRALGAMGDPASIPALRERLYDVDPDVCIDAVEALGRMGDPQAIPDLLELLHNHPDGEVRSSVVEALGNFSDPRVERELLICAAGRPANLVCDDEWDDWWDMQLHAVTALGRMRSRKAVPVLRAILEDEESQGIEAELLTALARIGGEGLEVLKERLQRGGPAERRRAATALGHAREREARELLGEALLDREAQVRSSAIHALGATGAGGYLKVILISLKDPDPEVRGAAAAVCGRLAARCGNGGGLAGQLVTLLDDTDPVVRRTTIETLETLDGEQLSSCGVPARIVRCLGGPDTGVAAAACRFVAHHRLDEARGELLRIAADGSGSAYLRQQAIRALGKLEEGDGEIMEALCRSLHDPEQPVRVEALGALTAIAGSETPWAEGALQAVLEAAQGVSRATGEQDPDQGDGEEPATPSPAKPPSSTLEAIDMALKAESPLQEKQPSPPEEIREHLELAERLETIAAPPREKSDRDFGTRILAIRVLAGSDREEAFTTLMDALQEGSPELRREAAISIGRMAARGLDPSRIRHAVGPLLSQLELGEEKVRHACIRALARLGSAAVLPHLLESLQDRSSQVRIEAVRGLVELAAGGGGGEPAITGILAHLRERLTDPAAGVRLAAAEGLARLLPLAGDEPPVRGVVERLIGAARIDHGSQARQMGCILREIEREAAVDALLQQLETLETSGERRFAMELLEELLASTPSRL